MAVTPVATEKFSANNKMETHIHAPAAAATAQTAKSGATTEHWKAMRDYTGIAVMATWAYSGGTGIILFDLYLASDSSGSDVVLAKGMGTANASAACLANTIGDSVYLEISAEDIAQLGAVAGVKYTHVSAWLDCQHNDDEVAVTYVRFGAKHRESGLTAASEYA